MSDQSSNDLFEVHQAARQCLTALGFLRGQLDEWAGSRSENIRERVKTTLEDMCRHARRGEDLMGLCELPTAKGFSPIQEAFTLAAGSPGVTVSACGSEATSAHELVFLLAGDVILLVASPTIEGGKFKIRKSHTKRGQVYVKTMDALCKNLDFLVPNDLYGLYPKLRGEFTRARRERSEAAPKKARDTLAVNSASGASGEASGRATKDDSDTTPHPKRERGKAKWLGQAMILVRDNPEWSDAKIAKEVGRDRAQLTRCDEYQRVAKMAREPDRQPSSGYVTVDPDSGQRDIEGISDNDDPAKMDWDK